MKMRKTTEELAREAGIPQQRCESGYLEELETFRSLCIENERENAEAVAEVFYDANGFPCLRYMEGKAETMRYGNKLFTFPPAAINRESVIEECVFMCGKLASKWYDGPQRNTAKVSALEELALKLSVMKSQPAAPDPRDEALRLSSVALTAAEQFIDRHSETWYVSGQLDLKIVRNALAAIYKVMEGK